MRYGLPIQRLDHYPYLLQHGGWERTAGTDDYGVVLERDDIPLLID